MDYIIPVARTSSPKTRTKPHAKPRGDYHHGDLRQALIAAAAAAVDKAGAETVSLAGLARALGVSQAAPFRHFADRDTLLRAVAEEGFTAFTAALAAAGASTGKRRLHDMCRAYVAFALARPGLYRLMFASAVLVQAPANSVLLRVAEGSFQLLVNAIPGPAARRPPKALRIWAGLHGVAMLSQQGLLRDAPLAGLIADIAR